MQQLPKEDDFSALGAPESESLSKADLSTASKEEDVLADGQRAVQKAIHSIVIWLLRFGAALLGCLVLVRFVHLAAPEAWRWLGPEDLQGIDKMLFSSAFGGVILGYLKDIMKPIKR